MPCKATKDRWIMVVCSDKTQSIVEENGKSLQYCSLEKPINNMKTQIDMTMEGEPPRSVGVQYTNGEEQRNSSRKNEEAVPKQKQCSVVNVSDGENKV